MKTYEVQKMTFDAARPYAVVATFRSFNKVIARYANEADAKRRARDMNRTTEALNRLGVLSNLKEVGA